MDRMTEFEGSDITAAHMLEKEPDSKLVKFYANKTIFLTGATGFLGKLFIEKLLRTCPQVRKILILLRAKKGKDPELRFDEIFNQPMFDPLKRLDPNFKKKIQILVGDIGQLEIGLNASDKQILIDETNIIIHCAATVRFDEKLRAAAHFNVRSVMEIIALGKQMKDLNAMLYVSTAYSNCIHQTIDEKFYEPIITPAKLLSLLDALDDDKIDKITPILLDAFPNTYVFTKSIAEHAVKLESKNLPIGICRPSIVISTVREPLAGWIDNVYGATGVLVGAAIGLIRSLHGKKENIAEMIPADYVINCSLAAICEIAEREPQENQLDNGINDAEDTESTNIYNCVSSPESPITWREFNRLSEKHGKQIPSPLLVWYYFFSIKETKLAHTLAVFFFHMVPAYIVDFLCLCIGKRPQLVQGYKKINKFLDVIAYFSCRQWKFRNDNVQRLWRNLNKDDRHLFEFSMLNFDWDMYFRTYLKGGRVYLLKDPMDTLALGWRKYYKLKIAHYTLVTIIIVLGLKLLLFIYGLIF